MSDSEEEEDTVVFEEEEFQVGSHRFVVTTIAYMPIEVLMNMNDKKVEISGQKLWCGSLGVIEYLQNIECSSFVEGATVVELGAGGYTIVYVCVCVCVCICVSIYMSLQQGIGEYTCDCWY